MQSGVLYPILVVHAVNIGIGQNRIRCAKWGPILSYLSGSWRCYRLVLNRMMRANGGPINPLLVVPAANLGLA